MLLTTACSYRMMGGNKAEKNRADDRSSLAVNPKHRLNTENIRSKLQPPNTGMCLSRWQTGWEMIEYESTGDGI